MNILIAEDDDISRDLLHRILEREADCALTMAEDGEKAWALLNDPAQHFDVGIFDLMMPHLGRSPANHGVNPSSQNILPARDHRITNDFRGLAAIRDFTARSHV